MQIERAALRAWPAARDEWIGSWLVRLDRGYTKRANCIYAWGGDQQGFEHRLRTSVELLSDAGLPPIVRMATWNPDPDLTEHLSARGIDAFDETIVMTRPVVRPTGWGPAPVPEVDLDTWLDLYLRFEGGTKGNQAIHREIVERIGSPKRFAVQSAEDAETLDPVSIGLAIADDSLAGLFDIATDPARRGRGYGGMLVEGMLAWGLGCGCTTSYLQVMASNESAVRLYHRLGFAETFRYRYFALDGAD